MELPSEFFSIDFMGTFVGIVLAVGLIVQFTKGVVKNNFGDSSVQLYAFLWSLVILSVINWQQGLWQGDLSHIAVTALLVAVNGMLVTMTAIGGYDIFSHKNK